MQAALKRPRRRCRRNTGSNLCLANANDTTTDAALVTVLSQLDFHIKKEQRTVLKAFLLGNVFALLPTLFGKSLVNHTPHLMSPFAPVGSLKLLWLGKFAVKNVTESQRVDPVAFPF